MPVNDLAPGGNQQATPLVRTEPIQERSAARIDALLDAAATVVDEIGFDRLTTAMVAERASASIGTVYRYFPDRIVLLQALRDRAVQRYRAAMEALIETRGPEQWWDAVECAVDAFVEMYRNEPGFRIIRFSDTERVPENDDAHFSSGFFAGGFVDILTERFGLPAGEELTFRLEVVVEIADALITRAFLMAPRGDESFIAEARTVIREYLTSRYAGH